MKMLIVEDNSRVSALLKRGLESQGYQVYISEEAEEGLILLEKIDFDLIITDIMLTGMDGITFCKKIRHSGKKIPIIMLTALGTIDEKIEGFDAGADDYLVKPFEIRELYARVKALLQRKSDTVSTADESAQIVYGNLVMDKRTKVIYREGLAINLTPKEFNLLHFMMQNPERLLTRDEIADNVWGNNFDTGTNYIDVYIAYLRKKIDKGFEQKLIHTKVGMGFILSSKI
ncbi:response regulator transcription factor [Flavobacterium hibernum]|uniref:DNA-binding response regulator n=1 Tax=Flavobacterium hibernum TaxID=37752 RepID=A0A0D0END1_9FLAO|nr:response regulator transcription factor [Flavobacterium hibernum]KIO54485.1 transcriptional regulator [Flavobacterium hibernum]OXA84506.1 DNA-binding response regulator [Flavobacterium hibernum]STO10225.1 Mycobacterial persistence regulator A [Flavobacterium hibernum]